MKVWGPNSARFTGDCDDLACHDMLACNHEVARVVAVEVHGTTRSLLGNHQRPITLKSLFHDHARFNCVNGMAHPDQEIDSLVPATGTPTIAKFGTNDWAVQTVGGCGLAG
jgi:hypothetical protein